jgi:hypothetical protein
MQFHKKCGPIIALQLTPILCTPLAIILSFALTCLDAAMLCHYKITPVG